MEKEHATFSKAIVRIIASFPTVSSPQKNVNITSLSEDKRTTKQRQDLKHAKTLGLTWRTQKIYSLADTRGQTQEKKVGFQA